MQIFLTCTLPLYYYFRFVGREKQKPLLFRFIVISVNAVLPSHYCYYYTYPFIYAYSFFEFSAFVSSFLKGYSSIVRIKNVFYTTIFSTNRLTLNHSFVVVFVLFCEKVNIIFMLT